MPSAAGSQLVENVILAMSQNETIKRNLEQVVSGETACDPVIRELAQAVLEEIHYARKMRKVVPYVGGFLIILIIIGVIVVTNIGR